LATTITVRGKLDEVRERLAAISGVINYRKTVGWAILQSDEDWLYVTHPELAVTDVCDVCKSHEGRVFSGDEVLSTFPYYYYSPLAPFLIYPRTHMPDLSKFANEPCHCEMTWLNALETIERRLHLEKQAAVL